MSHPVLNIQIAFNNTGSGSVIIKDVNTGKEFTEILHSGVNRPFRNLVEFLQQHIEVTHVSHEAGDKVRGVWQMKGTKKDVSKPPTDYSMPLMEVETWWKKVHFTLKPTIANPYNGKWGPCIHAPNKWFVSINGSWYCKNGQHKPKPGKKKVKPLTIEEKFNLMKLAQKSNYIPSTASMISAIKALESK